MTRLYVIVEGVAELSFVEQILKPHLEERRPGRIWISAPKLGGHHTFHRLEKMTRACLGNQQSNTVVTTMVDLFRVPRDYPGTETSHTSSLERVRHIEESCANAIADNRFRPYLQLHEFEALVLVDLTVLATQYPARERAIIDLKHRMEKDYRGPEDVNDTTSPSFRIKQAVPEYDKVADSFQILDRIGLKRLRAHCPHFAEWCEFLESVG